MIRSIITKHQLRFYGTLLLIVAEALCSLFFPLFIGKAIDSAIAESMNGVVELGVIGLLVLLIGVGRRVVDSRFYARIYEEISPPLIHRVGSNSPSIKSARLGMVGELVEFMENDFPELVHTVIAMAGVIVLIATLNLSIFYGSVVVTVLVYIIYWLSSSQTTQLNKASNDELENQVKVLSNNDTQSLQTHLHHLMKWNIKLSDLEARNFSISWVLMLGFLIASILLAAHSGSVQYGTLFALMMYVFQYMESVINLPFFYQNWLRLKEIIHRLEMDCSAQLNE